MDIRKYAVDPTGVLHLRDASEELMYAQGPDGKPDESKPMRVTLYGPGSKRFAAANAKKQNKLLDKLKKKGKIDQSAAEQAEDNAEFLVAVTDSMENVEYGDLTGEALFNAIYTDQSILFIAEQVAKYLGDWANFYKPSATS